MTVKVTKPALNLREEISRLNKPSGVAGEGLLRAETTADAQALLGVGRKNLLMNGRFNVDQRGQTGSPASTGYCADRWNRIYTIQYTKLSSGGATFVDTSGNNSTRVEQRIEGGAGFMDGNYVTTSFKVRRTAGLSSVNARFQYQSGVYREWGGGFIHPTNSWQTFSGTTYFAPGEMTLSDPTFLLYIGANNTVEITDVQVEIGRVVTPFEHRPFAEELALCQRYYQRINNTTGNGFRTLDGVTGWAISSTLLRWAWYFPVRMRAAPTGSIVGTLVSTSPANDGISWYINGAWVGGSAISVAGANDVSARVDGTVTGATAAQAVGLYLSADAYIELSADF